jgi:hypothetical protein
MGSLCAVPPEGGTIFGERKAEPSWKAERSGLPAGAFGLSMVQENCIMKTPTSATADLESVEASATGEALPVCLCPWLENPYRLVSLWDMLRFYAEDFCYASLLIGQIYMDLQSKMPQETSWMAVSGATKALERHCRNIGLPVTLRQIERVNDLMQNGILSQTPSGFARLGREIADISARLVDELRAKQILLMPDAHLTYYEQSEPLFGAPVASNFSSASYDIAEAGKCYSLNRSTACVFHLMRVLEVGLGPLAKRFNVPCDHTNWETVINRIEKAINEIDRDPNRPPNWKDEREFWSQCASHFRVVKDAWRNYTAHARGKYDEQEALDMLGNVRGFMQKLATRLHE